MKINQFWAIKEISVHYLKVFVSYKLHSPITMELKLNNRKLVQHWKSTIILKTFNYTIVLLLQRDTVPLNSDAGKRKVSSIPSGAKRNLPKYMLAKSFSFEKTTKQ